MHEGVNYSVALTLQQSGENEFVKVIQRGSGAVHIDKGQELPFALIRFLHDGNDVIANFIAFDVVVFQRRVLIE